MPLEGGLGVEVDERKAKIILHLAPRLGINFGLHSQQPGPPRQPVLTVAVDFHINDGVSVMVYPWLDVNPDDFEIAKVRSERVLGNLANLLLVNLLLTHAGSPKVIVA